MSGRLVIAGGIVLALGALAPRAAAQIYGNAVHTVTVQVAPITAVSVDVPALTLQITSAEPGQETLTISDATSRLLWGTNGSGRKITASTSNAAPRFELRLVALNPTRGSAADEFVLSTTPHDLLLDVGRSLGSCTLRYTGVAQVSQESGTDTHVVTFTVQSQ